MVADLDLSGGRHFINPECPWYKMVGRCQCQWKKLSRRLRIGIFGHVLGFLLARRFQQAGIITLLGWPPPSVTNAGGRIIVENCSFFEGVRLECWRDAVIHIGNGTYLNRNTEIVAARSVVIGRDCKIGRDVIIMDTDQHAIPGASLIARSVEI